MGISKNYNHILFWWNEISRTSSLFIIWTSPFTIWRLWTTGCNISFNISWTLGSIPILGSLLFINIIFIILIQYRSTYSRSWSLSVLKSIIIIFITPTWKISRTKTQKIFKTVEELTMQQLLIIKNKSSMSGEYFNKLFILNKFKQMKF